MQSILCCEITLLMTVMAMNQLSSSFDVPTLPKGELAISIDQLYCLPICFLVINEYESHLTIGCRQKDD